MNNFSLHHFAMSAKHEGFIEAFLTYFGAFQSDVKKLELLSSDIQVLRMNEVKGHLIFSFLNIFDFNLF